MPAREQIEVTPAVVEWARERAGYSAEELVAKFNKIEEWERGQSFPTYPQLERLADKLKVPVAVFFFPKPPDLPPISESFRTLPEAQFAQIPPRVIYLLRTAKAMQLNLLELNDQRNPADRLITRDLTFRPNVSIRAMGQRIRKYLGVSIEEQCAWASDEKALANWRQVLTDAGVFVFKDAFRVQKYSGFCLYDDEFPLIYVNNTATKTRQMFTLFHELAHLVFHTSGLDDDTFDAYADALPAEARRIEVICNRFAAQFLLPEDVFQAELAAREATEETAEQLANQFHVSRESIFRKFLDRNLINQAEYERGAKKWAAQSKPPTKGNYYSNQISYLGSRYINLALRQYYHNRINDTQLADYLNIPPKNLTAFEEKFARKRA